MATSQTEMGVWRDGDNPLVAEVDEKYTRWRQDKRIHEQAWYLNAAFVRGLQYVSWNDQLQKLTTPEAPTHRQRIVVNRIFSKFNARRAKFLKALPSPFVIPASPDRDDRLDAEATQKALEYVLRKERWEERYRAVLGWANICSKGFVWLHWDQTKPATIAVPDQMGGMEWTEQPGVGDVVLEVGSPFEVLVADSGIQNISDQPEIMRVKIREVSELTARFGKKAEGLKGEVSTEEVFQYQKQIATLSSKGVAGYHFGASTEREDSFKEFVVVKELFTRPCAKYPKGRWIVTAGGKLLSKEMELPLELWNSPDPYPCVEFSDVENVGQFWPTTYVEQLIPLQKEYNMVRSKAAEILRLAAGPKILTPLQTQFPKNAWNSEPLEVVRYQWYPGVPEPKVVAPPPMSQDAWNYMRLVKDEFDEVPNLYPQSQGSAGGATSGFQTNLLQEATDSIHAPDIRAHELSFIKLCYKIRHVMKLTYDVTRLLPITGRNMVPQVMEFSSDRINVNSEIVILGKTGLSQSPAVRTQQVIELWNARILGDQNDPKNQNRVLTLIDAEGIGPLQEEKRRDVDLARYEIDLMNKGDSSKEPQPYEDHDVHWTEHTDFMKSFEYLGLAPEIQNLHKIHLVLHAKFIDPMKAVQLAFDIGVPEVGEALKAQIMPQQPPAAGVPPQGPPPGVPPSGAISPPQ